PPPGAGPPAARPPAGLRGGQRRTVPEEDHLAAVDLDHLDVVDAGGIGEQGGSAPGTGDYQAVGAAGPHGAPVRRPAILAAAASTATSPRNTSSPTTMAGTSGTPLRAAVAVLAA